MSANEIYHETRKQLEKEIEILKQKLEAMDIDQKKDDKNYGWVGNIAHILSEINDINYGQLDAF